MFSAEQILDAISAATGVPETFKGYPAGTRGHSSWRKRPSISVSCKRSRSRCVDVSCECAARRGIVVPQMLHLLNNKGDAEQVSSP